MITEGSHTSHAKNRISWTLYGAAEADAPLVIYIHGFKGFKDWGFVPSIGEDLNGHGFNMLAFNFSHNGIGEVMDEFTEMEKFSKNTFSLELEETLEVIHCCHQGTLVPGMLPSKIGLLGHSRGGGIALLAGAQSPWVDAVCTWAAVSHFDRYPPEMIEQWRKEGQLEVKNARTGQVMHLGWNLHADLMEHISGKLNIRKAVESYRVPLCVVHGSDDEAVSIQDGKDVFEWAGAYRCAFHEIQGGNHTFGARHPWAGMPDTLHEALTHTTQFFRKVFVE